MEVGLLYGSHAGQTLQSRLQHLLRSLSPARGCIAMGPSVPGLQVWPLYPSLAKGTHICRVMPCF